MEVSVNNYRITILSPISANNKSKVYLAQNECELVILKMVYGEDKTDLYKRIQSLRSSYFPSIIDMEYKDQTTYVLEEYLSGKELSRILKEDISRADGYTYMEELIKAVSTLHSLRPAIIHRDIKPENIIITDDRKLKLLDFDAVREYRENDQTQDTRMLGTKGYAAPEQYGFSQTDVRSDIYSVGIVCHEIADKIKLNKYETKKLNKVLDKATMFDPSKRYTSADRFLKDISHARKSLATLAWRALFVILLLAALLVLIPVFVKPREEIQGEFDDIALPAAVQEETVAQEEYLGLNIIPEDYAYTPIAYECENYLDQIESENFPHEYAFYNRNPQALVYYSPFFEAKEIETIYGERYTDDWSSLIEKVKVVDRDDTLVEGGILCIGTHTLSKLKYSNYYLTVEFTDGTTWQSKLYIHAPSTQKTDNNASLWGPIEYYSITRENDIFFNVLDTISSIERVAIKGETLQSQDYTLTKDKKGLILHSELLNDYKNDDEIEIEIEMKNKETVRGKIVIIP